MKGKLSVLALTVALTSAQAHADWFKSVVDVASNVVSSTVDVLGETTGDLTAIATNALVRKALGLESGTSSQAAIIDKLGSPSSVTTVEGKAHWVYDINVLKEKYPTLTEIIKSQEIAQKGILLVFKDDVLLSVELLES